MHQNSACNEPSGEQKVVVECVLESPVFGMTSSVIDIHDAAQRGNIAAITAYIRAGGNLYAQDRQGNPPLHVASWHGCEASVAAFLGAGVDPAALNNLGQTPLYYARKNRHEGCVALLRGESPPTSRSRRSLPRGQEHLQPPPPQPQQQQQQQKAGEGDREKERDRSKKKKEKDVDKGMRKKTTTTSSGGSSGKKKSPSCSGENGGPAVEAPPLMLPPPPPPTAPPAVAQYLTKSQQDQRGGLEDGRDADVDWHLCRDEDGNAYYYNEVTGESIWAEAEGVGNCAGAATQVTENYTPAQQPPEGWSFHRDPSTGHDYYLHDATHESVWARTDGSFPGVENAADEGLQPLRAKEGDEGDHGPCADWEAEMYFAAGGMPAPTAPPPFSSTLELLPAVDEGTRASDEDTSMLLCTQRVMATNRFFAAQQQEILRSSSGGSPMTSPPPVAESGGTRSSCSPPPTPGTAPTAEEGSRDAPTHDELNTHEQESSSSSGNDDDYGDGDDGMNADDVQKSDVDNKNNNNNNNSYQQRCFPATPPPTHHRNVSLSPPSSPSTAVTKGPPPVQVEVWDTAQPTVPSLLNTSPETIGQSNNSKLDGDNGYGATGASAEAQARPQSPTGEGVSKMAMPHQQREAGPDAPESGGRSSKIRSKYERLLEVNDTTGPAAGSAGGASSWTGKNTAAASGSTAAATAGCYPKLVDRNGYSAGDAGGADNGVGKATRSVATPEVDGLLAVAAKERDLSMGKEVGGER